MPTAFIAKKIFTGQETLIGKAILTENEVVTAIVDSSDIPARFITKNLGEGLLAPAFIDIQIYGGNGKLFSTELTTESIEATYEYGLQGGCGKFIITMATNSIEKILKGIETVRQYWHDGGKGLIGLHLEGPYINPIKKGAHIEKYIKTPSIEEIKMLLEKGKGLIKIITIAPECCDPETLEWLLKQPIVVSAGHSNATYPQAMNGFRLGIPVATHLFNAMSSLQGREPGMVGAIYDSGAMSSIVCDGIHVDFASVRISKKMMKEKLFFITDAVSEVRHGEYQHIFKNDRYSLPDGTLSGSALTMLKSVKNGVEKVGIDLEEALRMASLYPAKLMGMDKTLGCIEVGAQADFVLLNEKLELETIILGGD
ncbi:MAG: N-acetylglucosamine-6-phosphate deacetylase [Bacteroidetes bacterium]|nr:N-acetylglucosamine-6-phosphate deacetylase [Bacteroidota bacterium]